MGRSGVILTIAERMPSYPGGMAEVSLYLRANTIFPDEARESGYSGEAIVQFVVDTFGNVRIPKIIKSSGYKCLNDEAIRVISKMSRWIPGSQYGKRVEVYVNLSVKFSINGSFEDFAPKEMFLTKEVKESTFYSKPQRDSIKKVNIVNYTYYEGVIFAENKNYKNALQKFDECLSLEPTFNDALYNKAVIHFNLGEKPQACEILKKLNSLNNNDADALDLINRYCN